MYFDFLCSSASACSMSRLRHFRGHGCAINRTRRRVAATPCSRMGVLVAVSKSSTFALVDMHRGYRVVMNSIQEGPLGCHQRGCPAPLVVKW